MNIIKYLRDLGYNTRIHLSLANVRTYKANKTIDDIEIQVYIETNKDEITVITIDLLKCYRENLIYNKLLKSKCKTLEELESTVNALVEIIRKEEKA